LKAQIMGKPEPAKQDWEALNVLTLHVAEPEELDREAASVQIRGAAQPEARDSSKLRAPSAAEAEPDEQSWEASRVPIRRVAKPEVRDPAEFGPGIAPKAYPPEPYREAPRVQTGREATPGVHDSETFKAPIVPDPNLVAQLQSTARRLALIVFALLGLLVVFQLYNWRRLEELTTLGKQHEKLSADAQATLQEEIERQRAALDQALHQRASLGQAHPKAISPGREIGNQRTAAAVHEQLKYAKARKEPRAEHQSAPSTGTSRSVDVRDSRATAREASSRGVSAMRQDATAIYPDPPAIRREPSANRQGTSPPPTSRDLSANQALDAIQNEPRKSAGTSGMKLTQPDTAIAHDHNEIEKLRTLGERDYVEFTLLRSNTRQEVAPDISLQLRKVDSKRLSCELSIYADDYEFPINLAINQPAVFPIRAMWESVELVIYKMGRKTVVGYLSARKGVLATGR
jgi:hypothetical protein